MFPMLFILILPSGDLYLAQVLIKKVLGRSVLFIKISWDRLCSLRFTITAKLSRKKRPSKSDCKNINIIQMYTILWMILGEYLRQLQKTKRSKEFLLTWWMVKWCSSVEFLCPRRTSFQLWCKQLQFCQCWSHGPGDHRFLCLCILQSMLGPKYQ